MKPQTNPAYLPLEYLEYGLGNSIPPERLSRTDVFVNFDLNIVT